MLLPSETLTPLYAAHLDDISRRVARVLESHGLDGLVIHSGTPQKKSIFDDQYWPLVAVPFFKHWLPLAVEGCALLVVPGEKPILYYNIERGFWEGPPEPESDHFWPFFHVVDVKNVATIREALKPRIGGLAGVGEDRSFFGSIGFSEDRILPATLLDDLNAQRVQKTLYERWCLREANRRAGRGHAAVLEAFVAGELSELDLHLLYLQQTEQDEPDTPYKNIVALNEHAATLHHVSYGRQRRAAQSLLLDAGATVLGYDSDITRTAVRGTGAVVDVFAGLIEGINRFQLLLCREARAGVNYQALHDRSHHLLASVLKETGIALGNVSEAALVEGGVTRKLFPHGLGHSLGLVTHDVGCRQVAPRADNPFLRHTSDITVDQCFTIEPGCYFIPSLLEELRALPAAAELDWRLLTELIPYGGVRIEDDVVVLEDGVDNLTRPFLP
jgi:Xaa-Pro dipeptidase